MNVIWYYRIQKFTESYNNIFMLIALYVEILSLKAYMLYNKTTNLYTLGMIKCSCLQPTTVTTSYLNHSHFRHFLLISSIYLLNYNYLLFRFDILISCSGCS